MVVELQILSPVKIHNNNNNNNTVNSCKQDGNQNGNNIRASEKHINKDQLEAIRTNLLSTNEVTFCNLSDDEGSSVSGGSKRRKRLISTESEDSINSSVPSGKKKSRVKIPDGGYGWCVVFASLIVSLIADGVSFSFGLIYTELLSYFKASTAATAWVGSLFMAVPLLVGPIMSNLVDKYGCRKMTILGGILSCSGFVGASMSNSIGMLYLTFGIIAGLGLGIGYVTCVVSIAFWFDKRRTFATGIGASGTGLGTFIYAPLTQYLIETFGWRGATLILAGTLLNMCVCGSLMRDPDWLIEENQLDSRSQSIQTFSNSSVCLDEIKELLKTGAKKEDLLDTLVTNVNTEANQQIALPDDIRVAKKYQSEMLLPTYIKDNQRDIDQNDSLRYCSRRSLRPDKIKSPDETLSREDFKQQIAGDKNKRSDTGDKSVRLASSETLNTMEKVSDLSETLTFDAFDDEMTHRATSTESMDDGYITGRQDPINYQSWHGSRFSLDENMMGQNKSILSLKNEHRRSNRGNSLDVVYENEIFNPNVETLLHVGAGFPSSKPVSQDHVHDFSIAVPPRPLAVNRHRKRKRPPIIQQNGNLKRNISLRYSNYFRNMRVHRNSIHYRGAMLNTHRYRLRASSCPNIYRNSMTTIAKENEDKWYDNFIDIIKSMFDFSLFLEFKFAMMSLSTLILFIWFIIPYFYITEHLLTKGYTEEESAYLISVIGIFHTIGMVFLGWIGDQPWLNVTHMYGYCLFVCGVSVFLMPLATHSYILLVLLAIVFGLTFASSFSFTPIILVRLVDLDDFTVAYGLILLVQGVGSLIGPPLAGFIYEYTNRWDDTFFVAGISISISGVLAYVIGTLRPDEETDDEEEDDECTSNE